MSTFKKNIIFTAIVVFILFLAFRYYYVLENLLDKLISSVTSIIIGAVIAYILNIPMTFFEKKLFSKLKNTPTFILAKEKKLQT